MGRAPSVQPDAIAAALERRARERDQRDAAVGTCAAADQDPSAPRDTPALDGVGARPRRVTARVGLVSAMTLATLNVWTGGPLLALWVGSQVQGDFSTLKMAAVGAAVCTLAVVCFVLVRVINWLDNRYGEVIGRPPRTRQPAPWLRSMRDKYGDPPAEREPLTALEWILVAMVVMAAVCLEVWFFFFAGSPLISA